MKHRRRTGHVNHERWLVSYADFITLLFAFFVVLYASSQVDKKKVGRLAVAIQVAFQEMGVFQASPAQLPIDPNEPITFTAVQAAQNMQRAAATHPESSLGAGRDNGDLATLQAELESTLAGEIQRKEIAMRREPDGLVISLREVGFFESGSAEMKSASEPAFDRIATLLHARAYRLRIEGHTDNVPIHNSQFSSNWELSTSRATEIVRLLIVRDGYSANLLSAAGYAEYHPVAPNTTAEGRAMNRRVDIVVIGRDIAVVPVVEAAGVPSPKKDAGTPPSPSPGSPDKPSPARPN